MLEPTAGSQTRIATLRKRWEADRGSSTFLPLAEEYRRLGRFRDAIDTLEAGLRIQPAYLSAQVALGRCLLESGDAAAAGVALERVLATDPTQLVANKLLVEAHLRAGRASQALGRLEAYTALNDHDPDVPGMRQRIFTALRREPLESEKASAPDPRLGASVVVAEVGEELFALEPGSEPTPDLSALWSGDDLEDEPVPPAQPASAGASPSWTDNGDELFPGLGGASARARYLSALFAEGLFAAVPVPALPAPEIPVPEPSSERESPPASADATVTLGELYRSQGHLGEAAQIFNAVLDREPDNAAALSGLTATRKAAGAATAEAETPMVAEGVTARKIRVLRNYLNGLRRGAMPDVP